jgi:hypothetical protein
MIAAALAISRNTFATLRIAPMFVLMAAALATFFLFAQLKPRRRA